MRASAILIAGLGLLVGTAAAQETRWNVGFVNAVGSSYLITLKTVPQRIAIFIARLIACANGSELYIQGEDGRMRARDSDGSDPVRTKG